MVNFPAARHRRLVAEKEQAEQALRTRGAEVGDELRDELVAKRKRDLRERRLGLGMRVIYVGFDEDVVQFNSHLRKLPKDWLALPFASEQGRVRAAALRSLFPAASRALPAVVIIDAEPRRGVLTMD